MSEAVSLDKAKERLAELVTRAAGGEEIVIAKDGVPVARLMSIASKDEPRRPAGALGLIAISPDFDEPLPEDIQASFDGRR